MRRIPYNFRPGPLTPEAAAALNDLARLVCRPVTGAVPVVVADDPGGIAIRVQTEGLSRVDSHVIEGDVFVIDNITYLTDVADNVTLDVTNTSKLAISNSAVRHVSTLTGLKAGQVLVVWNVGSFELVLSHMAGNVRTPNGAAYSLWPNDGVLLEYDGASWRFDVPTIGGGSAASPLQTYALRDLRAGTGLLYADGGDGSGTLSVDTSAFGSYDFWWFPPGHVGITGTAGAGPTGSPPYSRYQLAGAITDVWTSIPPPGDGQYTIYMVPLPRPRGGTIDAVAIHVDPGLGGGAGKVAGLAIYECTGTNDAALDAYPGDLLMDFGTVPIDVVGTQLIALPTPLVLTPGKLYWLAMWPQANFGWSGVGVHSLVAYAFLSYASAAPSYPQIGWVFTSEEGGDYDYDAAGGDASNAAWPATMANDGGVLDTSGTYRVPAIWVHYSD